MYKSFIIWKNYQILCVQLIKKNTCVFFETNYNITILNIIVRLAWKFFKVYFKQHRINSPSQEMSLTLSTQTKLLCKKNY